MAAPTSDDEPVRVGRRTVQYKSIVAVAFVLSLVCLGPPLFMMVANVLQSQGPDSVVDIGATLFDVVVAGVALTLLYTGVTIGAASLTDRTQKTSDEVSRTFHPRCLALKGEGVGKLEQLPIPNHLNLPRSKRFDLILIHPRDVLPSMQRRHRKDITLKAYRYST